MIIADTSGLLAYFNAAEPMHGAASAVVQAEDEPMVVSPYVLAELDHLVARRIGVDVELTVLGEIAGGGYELASLGAADLKQARAVIERYRDQDVGLADASLVVLAERYRTRTILTLDHRHFDVLRPLSGGTFQVVP